MGDPDRHVRKAAVVALSAVVHHKPGLVAGGLPELMPLLLDQTVIKPEMVRWCLGPLGAQQGGDRGRERLTDLYGCKGWQQVRHGVGGS